MRDTRDHMARYTNAHREPSHNRLRVLTDVRLDEDGELVTEYSVPYWCCQKCGEPIGLLGRLLEFLHIVRKHKCELD